MSFERPRGNCRRRGYVIIELMMALAILAVVLTAAAQLLALAGRQNQAAQRRGLAMEEAANLMERIASRPYGELTTENLASERLSEEARRRLPDPQLRIEVAAAAEGPPGKRILVEVQWRDGSETWGEPVRLAAWRNRFGEPSP